MSTWGHISGAMGMLSGDRVVLPDGRTGIADEFLQDGDAYVTLDDGRHVTANWSQMRPEARSNPLGFWEHREHP